MVHLAQIQALTFRYRDNGVQAQSQSQRLDGISEPCLISWRFLAWYCSLDR